MIENRELCGEILLIKLRNDLSSFTKKERVIAEYVLENPRKVSTQTIGSLADSLDLSPGLIVRFCQKLGFQGFPEFKRALGTVEAERLELPVLGNYSADIVVSNTFENAIIAIQDTLKINDYRSFDEVANLIASASRVEFFGYGGSARIAENAMRKFVRWKPGISFHRDRDQQLHSALHLAADCVAIGISYSGETDPVVQCLERAKNNKAKTVAITSSEQSSLAKVGDVVLLSAVVGEEMFSENEFTKIAQTVILDAIYFSFINRIENKIAVNE